ncbi:hypothetical protein HZH68_015406 [Vespula germanica]|uniref:Uncharacterized protein n=1 Tax=Vespula germanica TaxID=30212 RepID=A0A834MRB5_VESGE|nr:hypothetical protein HZH68_015406 [Vespula germanica]
MLDRKKGYRILGIFPYQSKSHFNMFETLTKGLAKKGHQVDVISPFPQKRPFVNYTDIVVIPPQLKIINNVSYNIAKNIWTVQIVSNIAGNDICEHLAHPDIQKLIHNPPKDPPYDVVLIQVFL